MADDTAMARRATLGVLEYLAELLRVWCRLRSAVALANAASGVSSALSCKALLDDLIAAFEALPGVSVSATRGEPAEDIYGRRRRKAEPPAPAEMATVLAEAEAARACYAAAVQVEAGTAFEVVAVDPSDAADLRVRAAGLRRELDGVVESLRASNARETVEIPDADLESVRKLGFAILCRPVKAAALVALLCAAFPHPAPARSNLGDASSAEGRAAPSGRAARDVSVSVNLLSLDQTGEAVGGVSGILDQASLFGLSVRTPSKVHPFAAAMVSPIWHPGEDTAAALNLVLSRHGSVDVLARTSVSTADGVSAPLRAITTSS